MAGYFKKAMNLMVFREPDRAEHFILREKQGEAGTKEQAGEAGPKGAAPRGSRKLRTSRRRSWSDSELPQTTTSPETELELAETKPISKSLADNLAYLKRVYHIPANSDIMLREFDVIVDCKPINAFIIFIDGMADRKVINDNILQPLMLLSNLEIKSKGSNVAAFVKSHLLPHNQLKEVWEFGQVIQEIDFGGCGIFIEGMDSAFTADVKGWEHRGVERPNTELLIRGPQEGFNEVLRVNTALIRKRLKDTNLITESIEIGEKSRTPCALMYINNIANDSLVEEVRRRLESIKVDYLRDSGELEQLIEDNTYNLAPQIIATERPDRVANALTEGRAAVVVHGSPFVLVMPTTAIEMTQTPEDIYLRFPYGSFLRVVRLVAGLTSLLLPALYIAVTNYHHEMIPTSLLLAIEASRERVPFPSVVEIIMMEFAFELIREAGVRIPGPIGPTLGIIGALILGQAAVAASIVSPVLIIVVAVTGIGSFAIPNFSLAISFRILRFVYICWGSILGLVGVAIGLFIHGMLLVSAKSFGVPFMIPFGPRTLESVAETIFSGPIWNQETRPDYLNTKDERKQPRISRGWTQPGDRGRGEDDQ
ncbi:MAG TPA: spore germination protein [Bacillota bacterium]|nr:spore germination protein [Bacillota bacterium]